MHSSVGLSAKHSLPSLPSRTVSKHICLNCRTASSSVVLMLIGALVVTHAMLRRLTSWRCIIIIIITNVQAETGLHSYIVTNKLLANVIELQALRRAKQHVRRTTRYTLCKEIKILNVPVTSTVTAPYSDTSNQTQIANTHSLPDADPSMLSNTRIYTVRHTKYATPALEKLGKLSPISCSLIRFPSQI